MLTSYYDLKLAENSSGSLAFVLARELGQEIVGQVYKPGQLIQDEAALASRFEVSRSVVRDSVKILVGKGLLEVRRGIGTRVKPRSDWCLLDNDVMAWSQHGPADVNQLFKLLELRQTIEPKAAFLAAYHATNADLEAIGASVEAMEKSTDTGDAFVFADAQFHRSILKATDNEFFAALEGVIFSTLLTSIRLTNSDPARSAESTLLHRQVFEKIRARDEQAAEKTMTELLVDAEKNLKDQLGASSETSTSDRWRKFPIKNQRINTIGGVQRLG